MGITYKFTDELIEFILQQKKNNPAFSCRQITNLVNEQFQINVSKSSVNNVIKDAKLSSQVGRRSVDDSPRNKFEIPADKKKMLLGHLDKTNLIEDPISKKVKPVFKEVRPSKEDLPKVIEEKKMQISKPFVETKIVEDAVILNSADIFIDQSAVNISEIQRQALSGMGLVIFKAAEWEMMQSSLMGRALRKHSSGFEQDVFDSIAETLLYSEFLGVLKGHATSENIRETVWELNETERKIDNEMMLKWIRSVSVSEDVFLEYLNEEALGSLEVGGFKIVLEDKTEIFIDTLFSTLWNKPIPWHFYSPIQKAMTFLSKVVMSNQEPIILLFSNLGKSFSTDCYSLIAAYENLSSKRMTQIVALTKNNQEVASFSTVPKLTRHFLISVWPWQKEFKEMTKSSQWSSRKLLSHPFLKKQFYYAETTTDFFTKHIEQLERSLRVFTIWEEKDSEPTLAVISNDFSKTPENLLFAYLERWPYLSQGGIYEVLKNQSEFTGMMIKDSEETNAQELGNSRPTLNLTTTSLDIPVVKKIFADFLGKIIEYSARMYIREQDSLKITNLFMEGYNLKGRAITVREMFLIELIISHNNIYSNDLENIIKIINERQINTFQKKKLKIALYYI
jgi:hypothetical protein